MTEGAAGPALAASSGYGRPPSMTAPKSAASATPVSDSCQRAAYSAKTTPHPATRPDAAAKGARGSSGPLLAPGSHYDGEHDEKAAPRPPRLRQPGGDHLLRRGRARPGGDEPRRQRLPHRNVSSPGPGRLRLPGDRRLRPADRRQ